MEELNERQRVYLLAVFEADQLKEKYRRMAASKGMYNRTPAVEWRRITYGPTEPPSDLYRALRRAGVVDAGTGSTWASLERRGLVTTSTEIGALGVELLMVTLTAKGRKLARSLTGQQAPKQLPPGTLKEWHWKAMAAAWVAGDEGLEARWGGGDYGGFSWNTWLRLRDYKWGSLVMEGEAPWSPYPRHYYRVMLTRGGREFYRANYARYRELYPGVEALHPDPEQARTQLGEDTWRVLAVLEAQQGEGWIRCAHLLEDAGVATTHGELWEQNSKLVYHIGALRLVGHQVERRVDADGDRCRLVRSVTMPAVHQVGEG